MTKRILFFNCKFCNQRFLRERKHQLICSAKCAFLSRIQTGDPNKCWVWTGSRHTAGYGEFRFLRILIRSHKFSYEYYNNTSLKPGEHICHTCDNPPCCNPNHLFKGNQAINMRDMTKKGRGVAKLTKANIVEIRKLLITGERKASVAKKFNTTPENIHHISTKKTWKFV